MTSKLKTKKAKGPNKAAASVLVRLADGDAERLTGLAERMKAAAPYTTPTSLARDALSIGLDAMDRLDALAERIRFASRPGLAREVLRVGLDAVEREPALLLAKQSS